MEDCRFGFGRQHFVETIEFEMRSTIALFCSSRVARAFLMRTAEGGEGFEDFFQIPRPGPGELFGESFGRDRSGGAVEGGFDGLDAGGEGFGPFGFFEWRGATGA
jgi:hypothetical protein